MRRRMLRVAAAVIMVGATCPASPAVAQDKSAAREGFAFPTGPTKILLIRPSIRVGSQSTGGLFEPNADWTEQARANIARSLQEKQAAIGTEVVAYGDPIGASATKLAQYQALFPVVANAVIVYQFFPGNRLPTKKRKGAFEWTLGPGIADFQRETGADYALFIFTEDQYGSTGRKVVQFLAAAAFGVAVQSGVHKGYAGLIDLRTGDLVWLNADLQMGGDVRTPEGAQKRVAQLLNGFPTRASTPATGQ